MRIRLGTGENLNEHVVSMGWPRPTVRGEMIVEAIEIIPYLLELEKLSPRQDYFIQNPRLLV